jgi:chromosomal replication initiator protein
MATFADWIELPENRSAREAVGRAGDCVGSRAPRRAVNPLFLHGPAGSGKSHLASALIDHVSRAAPDRVVASLTAADLDPAQDDPAGEPMTDRIAARQADLILVEDLQRLPPRAAEPLVQLLDRALARQQQLLLTAAVGPALLTALPARLTSRLAQGLVVELHPLTPASRLAFLGRLAERRELAVERPVLEWLAGHVAGSARQLDGALNRLAALARLHGRLPGRDAVAEHFRDDADARRPTVERIVQCVGSYFRVEPRQMQSRQRRRETLLPRQVGMYLARQLTGLSLQQIGAYFGGRDHSTVLHACRKVERALDSDLALSGAVRRLHADLA